MTTVDEPVCVGCGTPRPHGGPRTCPECGQVGRVISATLESKITATATVTATIATIVWSLWARRAYKECDDARAALQSASEVDDFPAIVFAVAAAAFALDGVALDLERPHGGKGHHPATPVGQALNRGDHVAAILLHEIGDTSDHAGWRTPMHDLFELRNAFAAHPETVPGSGQVSPARAALTLQAAEDAVTLLRKCLSALHTAGRITVPDDLRYWP